MRLSFIIIILVSFLSVNLYAQTDYMVHTVKSKESLSLLAKQYHCTVGEIMRLNGMNNKIVLKVGQKIKIPVKGEVSVAEEKKPETAKPVTPQPVQATTTALTHTVAKGETLYSISKKYKVSVDQLKQWNGIYQSGVKVGQVLVVGTSAVVINSAANKPEEKSTSPANKTTVDTVKKQTENNSAPAVKPSVVGAAAVTTATATKPEEKTYTPGKPTLDTTKKSTVAVDEPQASAKDVPASGFFTAQYAKGKEQLNGTAGIFKSASGWSDRKFYVLMNNIDANTIVKITANNRTVYAKVLGPLPEVKEDNGLLLRLSNAAASELGIEDVKFNVVVNY